LKKLFYRNFVENNFYGKFFKEKLNSQINKPIQTNNENSKNLNNSKVKVFQILSPSSPRKRQSGNVDDQQLSLILVEKVKIPKILNDDINTIDENLVENNNSHNPIVISTIDDILSIYEMKNPIINEKYANMISELNRIPDVNFDVFKLSQFSEGNELVMLMCHLMFICNFHESLEINKKNYKNYFYLVNKTYRTNSYHNSIHGCDVTQTLYFIFKTCNIEICCNLSPLELFSCYFASSIHDLDHPGNNNNYEIATGSTLAISYNDKAVLENYHLCKAFSLLRKQECDIYENFSRSNYNTSRAIIINMVLSTDMANHFLDLNLTKSRIESDDFNAEGVDKQLMLNELIHSADISNPMKPMDIFKQWIKRVFIEFYDQGDKERRQGLKISYLCDRYTVNIIDSQIGFIDNIVLPLYNSLADAFPNMKMFVNLINNNKSDLIALKQNGQNITLD